MPANRHAHTPAEARRVQLWVRDAADRWYPTPVQVRAPDGTWHLNPERAWAAREAAQAVPTVASVLGVPWQDVGPCARCRVYCHRYGDGGQPLCGSCQRDEPSGQGVLRTAEPVDAGRLNVGAVLRERERA